MRWLPIAALMLSGCAPGLNLASLEGPAATLMKPPPALPQVKEGDNLVVDNAKVRAVCSVTTSKLIRLQNYVRTITEGKS